MIEETLNIATPTTNALIKAFIREDILKEMTGQQRRRIYVCESYLKIFLN